MKKTIKKSALNADHAVELASACIIAASTLVGSYAAILEGNTVQEKFERALEIAFTGYDNYSRNKFL